MPRIGRVFASILLLEVAMLRRISWVLLVAGSSLVGGAVAPWLLSRWDPPAMAQAVGKEPNQNLVTDLVSVSERFELIARKASPAVVYVEAIKPPDAAAGPGKVLEESGSGVIVRLENRPGHFVL